MKQLQLESLKLQVVQPAWGSGIAGETHIKIPHLIWSANLKWAGFKGCPFLPAGGLLCWGCQALDQAWVKTRKADKCLYKAEEEDVVPKQVTEVIASLYLTPAPSVSDLATLWLLGWVILGTFPHQAGLFLFLYLCSGAPQDKCYLLLWVSVGPATMGTVVRPLNFILKCQNISNSPPRVC